MKGSTIIVATEPRGRFKEGVISGSGLLPGMLVVPTNTPPKSGRLTYVAAGANAVNVSVLLEDNLQGFGVGTAYTDQSRCRLYTPAAGEEINIMLASGVTPTIGALIATGAGGLGVAASTNPPMFQCSEALGALGANTLVWCEALQ